jgi:hypothetical protein
MTFHKNLIFQTSIEVSMMSYQLYFTGIFLFWSSIHLNGQYYLYDDDCLDYYANEDISDYLISSKTYRKEHQIIPFCRRDYVNDEFIIIDNDISSFRFDELDKRNITSLQLYSWSAHLDLVEEYQAFRENRNDQTNNRSSRLFYNCSSKQKLGLFCQYSFNSNVSPKSQKLYEYALFFKEKFDKIVVNVLKASSSVLSNGTCYIHLNCMRDNFSWCLDWREICDGIVDCWPDPVDEQYCNKLEQNECRANEYRCRNGQCIPKNFLLDNGFDPDCLDRTDENLLGKEFYPEYCNQGDPSFRCSDMKCPHWIESLFRIQYCGDADSSQNYQIEQFNRALFSRNSNYHLTDECWATMICLIQPFPSISIVSKKTPKILNDHFDF